VVKTVRRVEDGSVVCERCELAESFRTKLVGLMGRSSLPDDEGMLFRPTGSIHMLFMRFPIDVVFCDRELKVLSVAPAMRPWRAAAKRGAKVTVELAAGEAAKRGVDAGAQLRAVDA
jgi:uncharacterized protein